MMETFYHLKRHFDKDEDLWHDTGEVVSPAVGTIFYPCKENDEIEGGKLDCLEYKNRRNY